jgi:hypothetical protein
MHKLILILMINSLTFIALADEDNFLEVGDKNFAAEKTGKSKWMFRLGGENFRYPTTLSAYEGENERVKENFEYDISGINFGFGREFYFGAGFSSNITLGGFYFQTQDQTRGQATKDIDIEIASVKDSYFVYGYDVSISLNYLIDYDSLDIQPFIEAGVGAGNSTIEKNYTRENISNNASAEIGSELYDVKSEEEFLLSRVSLGVNFIAYKGLVSYLKVTSMIMNKTSREITGTTSIEGASNVAVNIPQAEIDETFTVTTGQIGIGYMF